MDNSPEHLIQHLITLEQDDVDRAFEKGQVASYLLLMGYTYSSLGYEIKRTGEYIRVLVKTYEAFPTEDDRRYPELSFYHYRLASRKDNPHHWMEEAQNNGWSTREMAEAIKGNPVSEDYQQAEQLLFKVKTMLADENVGQWFRDKLITLLDKSNTSLNAKNIAQL